MKLFFVFCCFCLTCVGRHTARINTMGGTVTSSATTIAGGAISISDMQVNPNREDLAMARMCIEWMNAERERWAQSPLRSHFTWVTWLGNANLSAQCMNFVRYGAMLPSHENMPQYGNMGGTFGLGLRNY